jgi:peptide/nickel transport system substrate-binding protein
MDLTHLIYSSLYTTDKDGAIIPDLVETETVSPDQKTYVLKLRAANWQDGTPVTADDVLFTLGLLQDPAWKSPLRAEFAEATTTKVDDLTVQFVIKDTLLSFRSLLTFGILPQHIWKDIAPADALQAEVNLKPIGSGPFAVDSIERDSRGFIVAYNLKRNVSYYAQPPYIERLRFQFYPDSASALDGLKRHDVDSLSFVPRDQVDALKSIGGITPVSLELPQATAVFFNSQKNSALGNKNVRRALAEAINKSRLILDVLHGEGRPLDNPPLPGYVPVPGAAPAFDPVAAGKLLDAAGWKLDTDGLRKKTAVATTKAKKSPASTTTETPLAIRLTVVDQPESDAAAKVIQESWNAVGVTVEIDAVSPSDIYRSRIQPRDYEALLYGQLLGADDDPYPYWDSSQIADPGLNLALFANKQADADLEAARKSANATEQTGHLADFISILNDQVPAVFLYSPTYTYPLPAALKGFGGTSINVPSDRFATVTSWYLQTKRVWK